jgi:hypothetical protein
VLCLLFLLRFSVVVLAFGMGAEHLVVDIPGRADLAEASFAFGIYGSGTLHCMWDAFRWLNDNEFLLERW